MKHVNIFKGDSGNKSIKYFKKKYHVEFITYFLYIVAAQWKNRAMAKKLEHYLY